MNNASLLNIALSEYGVTEMVGTQDNPEVLKYFARLGFGTLKDETAWCSAFMNWVAMECGLEYTGKLTARSWLGVGEDVKYPTKGDVVIFWRSSPDSWKGHVGIYINSDDKFVWCLGGNQSNQVNIKKYAKHRVLGYRRLRQQKDI